MDKTATAPAMTVVSGPLSVAAGTGCSEVFDTTIVQCSMVSVRVCC
jgi:hypothetical protein